MPKSRGEIIPYTTEKPPDRIKDLPKEAQEIWNSAFNSSLEKSGETIANKIAWAAVGKKFNQDRAGKWVKTESVITTATTDYINQNIKRIGEDEHFVMFNITLTGTGVMNNGISKGYKPAEEIRKIPGNIPKTLRLQLPSTDEHPKGGVDVSDDNLEVGFTTDIHLVDDPETPRIDAVDHVPKSRPDIIQAIESGEINGTSIGFHFDPIFQEGEFKGEKYNIVETNIRLAHNARLFKSQPACPVPKCGHKNNEGITMPEPGEEKKDKPTVIKTEEKKLAIGDVSLETLKDSNPAVKSLAEKMECLEKELGDLKEKVKPFEEDSKKLKEIEENERKTAFESLNEVTKDFKDEDKYSEDDVKAMSTEEINRLLKVLNHDKTPEGTVKKVVSGSTNQSEGSDKQWTDDHFSNIDQYDPKTGTYSRKGE